MNDSGIVSAAMNIAAMATNIAIRMKPSSARTRLPIQDQPTQHHHSTDTTSTPRSIPLTVRSPAINVVTWVSVNTNTRSKNSSSGVTVACSSTATARIRCLPAMERDGATGMWHPDCAVSGSRSISVSLEINDAPSEVHGSSALRPSLGRGLPICMHPALHHDAQYCTKM